MTGLRVNEATALRWKEDIDLENYTLTVNHSLRLKNKEQWTLGPTKTKAGMRTIALDTDTIRLLKDWKEKQEILEKLSLYFLTTGTDLEIHNCKNH